MKKHEKEVTQAELDAEKKVLRDLEEQYQTALKDIDDKVAQLLGRSDADMPNVIYQVQHQKALRSQIHGILEQLQANEFQTISDYLTASYQQSFVGTMYSIHNQGIPVILPIDQNAMVKAVTTNSRLSEDLYTSLGVDIKKLNNSVRQEISRGISAGLSYNEIARNIANASKAPKSRAATIVRTESHRIREEARHDGQVRAKEKGAEIVKRWDATLDGDTRPHHRKLDGQIREIDEPFEIGNLKAMYPGDFGRPEEDINCRCRARTKATYLLGEADLQRMQERAEYFGLDKTDDFATFQNKYLKAASEAERQYGVRYGAEASVVDFDYINSNEYKKKFALLTDDEEANNRVLEITKDVLKHRDGTEYEDMYLMGMDGRVIASVTNSTSRFGINYTDEFKEALSDVYQNNIPVIALHNHPHGTPPSADDFRKAFENRYAIGIAVGHNGQVYIYKNLDVEITKQLADQMSDEIDFMYRMGVDIDRASKMVYNEYGIDYTILEGAD